MINHEVSSQDAVPEYLLDPATQRPDEFKNHGIVSEFAQRAGWVRNNYDWTRLYLTEKQARSLEHLIEAQGLLAEEGMPTTPKEILDAVATLFSRGKTAFSHTELGEVVKARRQPGTNSGEVVQSRTRV